ncbi:low molecular weight phosphotyrosine protein phosphatase [Vibrio sp. 404]|uniref:protein-tyrosine-phosphatase n=1 Tax=Vibrio marinisediminis TaxID=2758441 RepID=A0A7W2FT48_9VIBR|nr:low molecular weight protein-tyrosine-phosphatase [Vibrio marinisediminis]MBA5763781.1 low molecular weight phosphotyrosine protein phosphatase [Vibrio marinisediminis]
MFNRFLIVCSGNICRSPLAAELLSSILPGSDIRSSGTLAKKSELVGMPADPTMQAMAKELELDLSQHSAKQLTEDDCEWSDIILVMEPEHITKVSEISPRSRGKTFLLGQWGEGSINDPFQQSEVVYRASATQIKSACESWSKKV